MFFLRGHPMSLFADRELLTTSATVAILGILFGGATQFNLPIDPEYRLGYALIGAGALLLLVTFAAWRNRRMMNLLRLVLGGLLAMLLLGILLGYDPTERIRPQGRFVMLVDEPQAKA
jgi:ABC-type Fe3+-siderophore transport system permease subunit